jgi:hypothetical protein
MILQETAHLYAVFISKKVSWILLARKEVFFYNQSQR